jgi:hypothetical protein
MGSKALAADRTIENPWSFDPVMASGDQGMSFQWNAGPRSPLIARTKVRAATMSAYLRNSSSSFLRD